MDEISYAGGTYPALGSLALSGQLNLNTAPLRWVGVPFPWPPSSWRTLADIPPSQRSLEAPVTGGRVLGSHFVCDDLVGEASDIVQSLHLYLSGPTETESPLLVYLTQYMGQDEYGNRISLPIKLVPGHVVVVWSEGGIFSV